MELSAITDTLEKIQKSLAEKLVKFDHVLPKPAGAGWNPRPHSFPGQRTFLGGVENRFASK